MSNWNEKLPKPEAADAVKPVTKGGKVLKSGGPEAKALSAPAKPKPEPTAAQQFMRSQHGLTSTPPNVARSHTRSAQASVTSHIKNRGRVP